MPVPLARVTDAFRLATRKRDNNALYGGELEQLTVEQ